VATPTRTFSVSAAASRFSEIVRGVCQTGESVLITVDGEPAVQIVPIEPQPRNLTAAEMDTVRALMDAVLRVSRPLDQFNVVGLVGEGRR